MGTAYTIKCKVCGARFDYSIDQNYGVLPKCVGCGDYVESQMPIRCPGCQRRINSNREEFDEQVEVVVLWD